MRHYFIAFTSRSALTAFTAFLLIGAASIGINYYPHWIATISVVIYSLILLVAQFKYHILLSQENKNSPYFLGFILTMWCLFNIFINIKKVEPATFGAIVIPQIGAAMLTTIVGLFMRHFLTSGSAEVSEQEKIFKAATDDLKENVIAYKMAQVKLINLIDEFVASHQQMMEQIGIASKEHLNLLSESSDALAKLGRQYPSKINKMLDGFDEIVRKLEIFSNNTIPSVDQKIKEDISANMTTIVTNFANFSRSLFTEIGNSLSGLRKNISEISSTYTFAFKELPTLQSNLLSETEKQLLGYKSSVFDLLKQNTQSVAEQFTQVKDNLGTISNVLTDCNVLINDGFKKSLEQTSINIGHLSLAVEKVIKCADDMEQSVQETHRSISNHAQLLTNEINEIDKLVETFIEIMKRRLH